LITNASRPTAGSGPEVSVSLSFDDNRLLPFLYGEHDRHLARIEHQLGVSIGSRGNTVTLNGSVDSVAMAQGILENLWQKLLRGAEVGPGEIDAAIRMSLNMPDPAPRASAATASRAPANGAAAPGELAIRTRRRTVEPRSPRQATYVEALQRYRMVFGIGPAGTGKTYLAVAQAVSALVSGAVERIILSRPAVEAGERLGFLPGDMKDKVDPYLRPLYDALHDMLPADQVAKRMESGEIEVAPLAFMRGRTLAHSFVILDEAQNTTAMQMKMFLTRLGEGSRMVITGDTSQIDLPRGTVSGLKEAMRILDGVDGISFIHFQHGDVVRDELVARIVRAYDESDREIPNADV
jgi:phosphate starvation-inducible PhoH-like protein